MVPDSQDEFPTVHLSDPPLGEETPAPSETDPWGQEGTSQVSLTRDDSASVSDSLGEFVSVSAGLCSCYSPAFHPPFL